MTINEIQEQLRAHNHEWPTSADPEFWSKVSQLIDREIGIYGPAVRSWWLVWRLPLWYPQCTAIEMNFLIAVQDYYRFSDRKELLRKDSHKLGG
jgi:hypothetical protein